MLIARVYEPVLFLESGEVVTPPRGAEILHDETGQAWPKSEVLVTVFRRTGRPVKRVTKRMRRHFGEDYTPKEGRVDLPPRSMGSWREVGAVARYEGYRRGEHHDPDGHYHDFGERGLFGFSRKDRPVLYRRGEAYRIVAVEWDWTGSRG